MSSPTYLHVQNLTVAYNGRPVLHDVSFRVPHGARVAVVGPNGAGKSTLFKTLVGLLTPRAGQIILHDQPLPHHKECVAYVPQREQVDWNFPVTAYDVVLMGRYGHLGWLRRPTARDHAIVTRCLEQMQIADLARVPIGELSGGQQQRVFLARALAQEPHILLMDEPFTGVDATTQQTTLELLDRLRSQSVTVLVSTHDLNLAATRFDLILLLNRRVIAFGDATQVFTPEHITQAFGTRTLMLDGKGSLIVDECCPPGEV
ncbi:MAG: metal ABC transporter ATP-binding protein [Anaerolineae bacterium]|nr:metal ABC transporter ATP-binding protein [Anaerolineae bacterium]